MSLTEHEVRRAAETTDLLHAAGILDERAQERQDGLGPRLLRQLTARLLRWEAKTR
jgi:hypothetical protein